MYNNIIINIISLAESETRQYAVPNTRSVLLSDACLMFMD
jgi:hypothetical protein